jgi:hypothetical protein
MHYLLKDQVLRKFTKFNKFLYFQIWRKNFYWRMSTEEKEPKKLKLIDTDKDLEINVIIEDDILDLSHHPHE